MEEFYNIFICFFKQDFLLGKYIVFLIKYCHFIVPEGETQTLLITALWRLAFSIIIKKAIWKECSKGKNFAREFQKLYNSLIFTVKAMIMNRRIAISSFNGRSQGQEVVFYRIKTKFLFLLSLTRHREL